MFYIYVKLYSHNQLKLVDPERILNIENNIDKIHEKLGGIKNTDINGLYRYTAFYNETLLSLIEGAKKSLELLLELKDDLDGFNILITKTTKKDFDLQKKVSYLINQILDDGGIWIDPLCFSEMSEFLSLEKEYYLYRMIDLKKIKPITKEKREVIFNKKENQQQIDNWLNTDDQILILKGVEGMGKSFNLYKVLEKKYGLSNIINLSTPGERDNIYDPYIDHLKRVNLKSLNLVYGEFLDELVQGKMMQRCSDFFSQDFEAAFIEYITEKNRYFKEKNQPLIIVVKKVHLMSLLSRKLLDQIIDRLRENENIKLIILENEKTPLILKGDIKSTSIYFKNEKIEIIQDKLSVAFPDMRWTQIDLNRIEEMTGFNSSLVFHVAILISQGKRVTDEDPVDQIINSLTDSEKKLLVHIMLGSGMFTKKELAKLFIEKNGDESLIYEQLNRFTVLNLIQENENNIIVANFSHLTLIPIEKEKILNELITLSKRKKIKNTFNYFQFLEKHGKIEEALDYLAVILGWLINNGFKSRAIDIINNPPFVNNEISNESKESLQNLLYTNNLRLALQDDNDNKLEDLISHGILSKISERGRFVEDFYIQLARYYYYQGNMEQAINYSKEALYTYQKEGNHLGESLANIELAFAFLGQRKVQNCIDYFEIARRISYQIEDNYTLITAHAFGALAAFLFGNISKAESMIEQVLLLAKRNGSRKRTFFLLFFLGRIKFEYGLYRESADLFIECANLAENFSLSDGFKSAKRWAGRSLLYLEKRREAFNWLDTEDSSREGLFFLAESDYMVSLYDSALKRLDKCQSQKDVKRSYTERDNWCDGFMPIEGRFSSKEHKEDVLQSQIEALNCHILAQTGRQEEALQFFNESVTYNDFPFKPYSYKYSYIQFTILNAGHIPLTGDDQRLACLSKSIERLQSRAGRFDNQRKKLDFLNKNWWNKRIMDEAHKKKFL
jgi:hypothetical protein